MDASFERHRQHLHAAADAEDGYLTVECQTSYHQFGQVANGVDVMQLGGRLFASPQRVDVRAARQYYCVHAFQR